MRWRDSGFNTEDCSLMGIHCLGTSRQTRQLQENHAMEFTLGSWFGTSNSQRIGWASSHRFAVKRIFFPFLAGWHGISSQTKGCKLQKTALYLVFPDRPSVHRQFFQELKQKCQFLVWTRGEVLDLKGVPKAQLNASSAVIPPSYCLSRWSPITLFRKQKWTIGFTHHTLQDVFQLHKRL